MANRSSTGLSLAEYPASEVTDYVICELNEAALQRLNSSQETLRDYMLLRGYSTFLIREDGGLPIMVPEKTRILPRLNCSLVMFTSPSNVGAAWPEVGT